MENKPRYLTVCSCPSGHPKFWIQGLYLEGYGFEVGAQISLANPESGTLIVKQVKSRKEHQLDKKKSWLEDKLVVLKKELGSFLPEKKKEILSIEQELNELNKVA